MARKKRRNQTLASRGLRGLIVQPVGRADRLLADFHGVRAERIDASKNPKDFENQRQINKAPVRSLADMTTEEKRGIEKVYGMRLCETLDRRRR